MSIAIQLDLASDAINLGIEPPKKRESLDEFSYRFGAAFSQLWHDYAVAELRGEIH